jgi:hypothetical protein
MKEIIIQAPSRAGATPIQVALAPGHAATIGICRCGQCDLDLPVYVEGTPSLAGRITAGDSFWLFTNLSDRYPVTVDNMDDWYQYIIVDPGRMEIPVPFELAQIELTASPLGPKISVFGHEPRYNNRRLSIVCRRAAADRPLLDARFTYFAVLRELCVRRLDGEMDAVLPTSAEIADRLSTSRRRISPRAVDAHIRYVSEKLGLPKGTGREALVAVVIRSGLLHLRD